MALLAIIKFISVSMKSELIFSARKSERTILTRISDALIETSQSIWIICVVRIVLLLPQPRLRVCSCHLTSSAGVEPHSKCFTGFLTKRILHVQISMTRRSERPRGTLLLLRFLLLVTKLLVHSQPMRYRGSSLFRL